MSLALGFRLGGDEGESATIDDFCQFDCYFDCYFENKTLELLPTRMRPTISMKTKFDTEPAAGALALPDHPALL